jgi:hypothetical protein
VKSWLFTTLYREFLARERKVVRFPHRELEEAQDELPAIPPNCRLVRIGTSSPPAWRAWTIFSRVPWPCFIWKTALTTKLRRSWASPSAP